MKSKLALLLAWFVSSHLFQAGSAHVRIRRDANEQLVLAHVTNRLLPLVSTLTVQIFKDDWMRPLHAGTVSSPVSAPHQTTVEGYTGASLLPLVADPLTSTPSKHSSPLPEFAFETPGRNVAPMVLATSGLHLPRPYGGLGLAYGPSHYTGVLNQGPVQSGFGLRPSLHALGVAYRGLVVPASENFRTSFGGSAVSLQFSTGNPSNIPLQQRHYQPWTFGPHTDPVVDQDHRRRVSEFSWIPADEEEKQKPEVEHVTFNLWLGQLMTECLYLYCCHGDRVFVIVLI